MIARVNKHKVDSEQIAKDWLIASGYKQVKGAWMKGARHAARIERMVTGRVAIIEGVTV